MTRVFISKVDEGWFEVDIPEEFSKFPYEKLVNIMHKLVQKRTYKGLLITENPMPFPFAE